MPISIACECGRKLKVKDESAGRKVRCPDCTSVLVVPTPSSAANAEEEALNELLAEGPPPITPPAPQPIVQDTRFEEVRSTPVPRKKAKPPDPTREAKLAPYRDRESYSGIAIHPQIIIGVLMMIGATVWFFLGLAAGRIFIYPPIMFVLGIGAIIKGFTGRE